MQQQSLLQTKLHIPPIWPELISRPRLLEQLNAGLPTRAGLSRTWDAFPRALTLVYRFERYSTSGIPVRFEP
jgi:hypothetical protein